MTTARPPHTQADPTASVTATAAAPRMEPSRSSERRPVGIGAFPRTLAPVAWSVLTGLLGCQPGAAELDGTESSTEEGSTTGGSSTSQTDAADSTGASDTSETTDSSETGESTSTGPQPSCGDGIVDAAEECDGADLLGATCESQGFNAGTLVCGPECVFDLSGCGDPPGMPVLTLGFSPIKQFELGWDAVAGADYYQIEESVAPMEPFVQVGGDVVGESISLTMPLHLRFEASYRLRACNVVGCTGSAEVSVMGSLAEAVGYVKASNTDANDRLGLAMALSGDGRTLAVGAEHEGSSATGIDGNQADDSSADAGAVYVFARDDMGTWSQQAYVKASNTDAGDYFGVSVALSEDGNTLAVGAFGEDGSSTGVGGNEANDSAESAGAVYVLVRDGMGAWSQQAYVKASNAEEQDAFGGAVALSSDGNTLAVAAWYEDSSATGIDGDQADDSARASGAVYVLVRDGMGAWSQQAYVKASNTGSYADAFGSSLALSGDGNTLAVASEDEDSNATGIDGNQLDNSAANAGAVYVFVRDGLGAWAQQAYVKASNTAQFDSFGVSVALSEDGDDLAVGANAEDSGATGIDGNQADGSAFNAGAAYVFTRSGLGEWSQQAYVKASNTDTDDYFGHGVALSADGSTLAVGAPHERSNATAIEGDQADDSVLFAGATYVFVRDGMGGWSQRTYVKASTPGASDYFGFVVALSSNGDTLAVGANGEDSSATGIGGDQADDTASGAGAVYLY